jgi:hypothetical protein
VFFVPVFFVAVRSAFKGQRARGAVVIGPPVVET